MWDLLHRPLRYADVLGQDANVRVLKARIRNGTAFDVSYIFAGGYGRGKTTLARIHARAMLCQQLDKRDPEPCNQCDNCLAILNEQPGAFTERDAASVNGVDAARSLVDDLAYVLENAPKRIYLLDEAQRMTVAAQDVLLKPIEDKLMIAMFCTTEVEKVRSPIRSRCELYAIARVPDELIVARARSILDQHGVNYDDEALRLLANRADGHVRDVVIALESLSQVGSVTVDQVREHLNLPVVSVYYEILLHLDEPKRALEWVDTALQRVSPGELSAGLADAALTSHKLAQQLPVDLALVDRALAEQVQAKYRDGLLALGEWFLRDRMPTRTSLQLRVMSLAQTQGNIPVAAVTAPRPIQIAVPAAAQIPAAVSAPPPMSSPNSAATKAPPAPVPVGRDQNRDPTPAGSPEEEAVRLQQELTRQRGDREKPLELKVGVKTLTPAEWTESFWDAYRQKTAATKN